MTRLVKICRSRLGNVLNPLVWRGRSGGGNFSERIKKRHHTFWNDATVPRPERISMEETSTSAWKEGPYWQRRLSNKYASRRFAELHGCKVPDLYWRGTDVNELELEDLPRDFVIRPACGHSSKSVFLMSSSTDLMSGRELAPSELKRMMMDAQEKSPGLEFLVEEFLMTEAGEIRIPDDYKVYAFNGHIACIQLIERLGPSQGFTSCYDTKWRPVKNVNRYYQPGSPKPAPACLEELVDSAVRLSRSYEIFVRIDLYATQKGAVFGEFTPTPFLGAHFTPEGQELLLSYWDRYCNGTL